MKRTLAVCLLTLLLMTGCNDYVLVLDVQGHRGARGHFPENTLEGFAGAIDMGVNTLELDVVISKDREVVVSHEPWLSAEICTGPNGEPITEATEKSFNLYQMDYSLIQTCDCGSKGNPRFPQQQKLKTYKPLLKAVFAATHGKTDKEGMPIRYNIELKREAPDEGLFYPDAATFADLVLHEINSAGVSEWCTLQSFDVAVMKEVHQKAPTQRTALLIDEHEDFREKLAELGYYPQILSPWYELVNEKLMSFASEKQMSVIPWTVNEVEDMRRMIHLRVEGIITDYPDRLLPLLEE